MKLLPSCHEVQTQLTEYAEGSLPLGQRLGIGFHLLICRVCAGFFRGLQALPGFAKRALSPPAHAPEEAGQALQRVLRQLKGPS